MGSLHPRRAQPDRDRLLPGTRTARTRADADALRGRAGCGIELARRQTQRGGAAGAVVDIFRTELLEAQGWKFHRLWVPQIVRDPEGAMKTIAEEARPREQTAARKEPKPPEVESPQPLS